MSSEERGGRLSPWLSQQRMRISQEYLRGRVLDFGCNDGALLEYCSAENYVGLDIAENGLSRARAKHPDVRFVAALEPDEKFDTVAALAMIEHVPNPGKLLAEWAGLLAPGGRIVLTTPHPRMEWAHTVGAKLRIFSSEAHDEHEDLLDRPKMAEIAGTAGLRILVYKRFLFGANQLFVLAPVKSDVPTDTAQAAPAGTEAGTPAEAADH
ncbi:MAG TPA: class I SAM-dependent methyltransferase [Mycobacteriales bacterium]|nr:class I SAM-dependent methyltransferase [Mycobacteriales bacterium]